MSTRLLEAALLANLLTAVVAAAGIYRDVRWGWRLGVLIACAGVALYVVQETVGLPGLPTTWWEPSRIVTLAAEASFLVVARYHLVARGDRPSS